MIGFDTANLAQGHTAVGEIDVVSQIDNLGIMMIKNKKSQSIDYNKKRKLTKLNKDTNLGLGKVWANRFKSIIIPKILPKNQFNCQQEVNIVNEIIEIRNVNQFLLGNENGQRDGTIMSIDFKNAFRSMSLRWFNLVMKKLKIPKEFLTWFWSMYKDLYIYIVINRYKSEKTYAKRGFLEGHPPSMACFVVGLIPLMIQLEETISGIKTMDGKIHKIKLFADDLKLFFNDVKEIESASEVIKRFEMVSGLEMHRDPARNKCQALPFGSHISSTSWPEWVTVRDEIKIVGAMFSNRGDLEKLNSNLVSKCFYDTLHKNYGIKGTILQKAYFVNTYLFSKIWYCQAQPKVQTKASAFG